MQCYLVNLPTKTIIGKPLQYIGEEVLQEEKKGSYLANNALILYYHGDAERKGTVGLVVQLQIVEMRRTVEEVYNIGFVLINPFAEVRDKH